MSRIYDAFKTPEQDTGTTWFLRTSDEIVYGPVNMATLASWVRQNRIAPGNKLSCDQKEWVPAENVPELEMVWKLVLASGELYGPIHLKAAPHLVRQGVAAPDAVLRNRITGEEVSVQSLLEEEQRQLPLDDMLNAAAGYHEPSDKPSQTSPVAAQPETAARSPVQPAEDKSRVSQMALELSGFVERQTGIQKPSRLRPGEVFKSMRFFHRNGRDVRQRLSRKVQELQDELQAERRRFTRLQEELLGVHASFNPPMGERPAMGEAGKNELEPAAVPGGESKTPGAPHSV